MSGNNRSFNYSLLLINCLKINIMLLFQLLPFFSLLIQLALFINLGVFHDTLMAPAAQQSLSQCHLSPPFPSISPLIRQSCRAAAGANVPQIFQRWVCHSWAFPWCLRAHLLHCHLQPCPGTLGWVRLYE